MIAQALNYQDRESQGLLNFQKEQFQSRIKFLTINQDFKFKEIITYRKKKCLLVVNGQLVYNNGATVPVNNSHLVLFNRILNNHNDLSKSKIIFAIDLRQQTLVFTGKISGIRSIDKADEWIDVFQKEALSKKRVIITLLVVIGFQMDSENLLMKQILLEKKNLKFKLEQILHKSNEKQPESRRYQNIISQTQQQSVIYFGPREQVNIQLCRDTIIEESSQTVNKKKVEGGYFSIQNNQYKITNNQTQQTTTRVLCRKTLREKRKKQDQSLQQNQRKMKKQLQIVSSIKDKRYLIKYYCEKDTVNLEYVLMQKYDYSLQQYIYYFGDSLEIQYKIIIAQQIVEAIMTLHQSGVVHRDIKPSNFLIEDNYENPNYYKIKIIDFAQSYSKNLRFYQGDYACSHPYSPLQCSEMRSNNPQGAQSGIINKQIDYWSVGITLYEVFFRKLPVSFSRAFQVDIATSWKTELLLAVNQRQKYGLALVDDIITIICIKMMKIQQQKRMNLTCAMKILKLLEEYVNNIIKIAVESK